MYIWKIFPNFINKKEELIYQLKFESKHNIKNFIYKINYYTIKISYELFKKIQLLIINKS